MKSRIEKKFGSTVLSNKEFIYEYDHVGRKVKFKHSTNGVLQNVTTYKFDAIGRMQGKSFKASDVVGSKQTGNWTDVSTWLSNGLPTLSDVVTINTGQTITIPNSESGSAGRLVDNGVLKNFGKLNFGKIGANPLHEIAYKYHVRGGLKGINTDANNNLTSNLFSFRLEYDGIYYDGNIRKQEWKSNIDNVTRSYTYTYDGSSRIKASTYMSSKTGENYALNNVNYDANGNITNLSRNGLRANSSFGLIDNLNYTYNTNSNKILKVDDASNETNSFKDVSGNDYTYWADGSLKRDNNKGIDSIKYNYLKLPERIKFANSTWINYEYDAGGTKLKKTLSTGKVTDYEEDDIYENGILYQTAHDEGRIVNGVYEYNINDHLGNLRVAFKDSSGVAKITQVNAYGAFGDDLPTLKYINSLKINKFTFQEQELQDDFGLNWYQFKWRMEDPILGRFISIDPISEKFYHNSPFAFSENKVISHREFEGLEAVPVIPETKSPKVDKSRDISSLGVSGKVSVGLAAGAETTLLGFKFGGFGNSGSVDVVSGQLDAIQGASLSVASPNNYTYTAGFEGGIGVIGGGYGVEKTTTTDDKGNKQIKQKSTLEVSIGPASFIRSTFENIDPKTNKAIQGSTSSSSGFSLFKTEAKVGLGFKIEGKANMVVGMGGEVTTSKPLGVAPTDATSTRNTNINMQQFIQKK